MIRLRVALVLALASAVAGAAPGPAPGPAPMAASVAFQGAPTDSALEAQTAQVASQLRCPVCQGLSIQDSPSELSQQMRAVVKDQLRAGRTPDQVKAYFISKYGEWILLEPRPAGFNLLVYALPILLILAGLGVIIAAVRKWTRPPSSLHPE